MGKLTSYTELNATLVRRTGLSGFDFSRADERAAMGYLLYLIVELNRPATGLMISVLVSYLDANDAGSGFYGYAQDLGMLQRNASAMQKLEFWAGQVKALREYYSARLHEQADRRHGVRLPPRIRSMPPSVLGGP